MSEHKKECQLCATGNEVVSAAIYESGISRAICKVIDNLTDSPDEMERAGALNIHWRQALAKLSHSIGEAMMTAGRSGAEVGKASLRAEIRAWFNAYDKATAAAESMPITVLMDHLKQLRKMVGA